MKQRILLLLVLLCAFTGIANAQSPFESKKFESDMLNGKPMHLQFKDSRYVLHTPDMLVYVRGYFEIKGDTITFKDVSGPMACKPEMKGVYRFTYENKELKLELIKEECSGRQQIASSAWKEIENKK